jgi:hypothetical protein
LIGFSEIRGKYFKIHFVCSSFALLTYQHTISTIGSIVPRLTDAGLFARTLLLELLAIVPPGQVALVATLVQLFILLAPDYVFMRLRAFF